MKPISSRAESIATDKPGTVRLSPEGDVAFLTLDEDPAPWFHVTAAGFRYWATYDDVKDWPVKDTHRAAAGLGG